MLRHPLRLVALALVLGAAAWAAWRWATADEGRFPTPRATLAPPGLTSQPLRPARRAEGPRFVRLATEECGLDFTNVLRKENRYQYLTNGAGLCVGDYDHDGLPDVYLVSQDGPNKLFRQVAPLRFADVTESAGGLDGGEAWGTGATFADVDGDGDLDLYVCNLEAPNLLYVNQGDGTFREDAATFGLDLVAASMMAAFADYDRDGHLDLYLLTNRALHAGWASTPEVLLGFAPGKDTVRSPRQMVPTLEQARAIEALRRQGILSDETIPPDLREHYLAFRGRPYMAGQPDRLLRSVGGRFVDVTTSAGIADHGMGLSATWFDYDDDGYPDLYVTNDLESPDILYHNERNGTFRNVTADVVPHTAYYGMGSCAGDIDGDGLLDLIVADMSMTTHRKAKVLMGDMDNQRPVLRHARPPQYMRNALLLNTGLGRFSEAARLAGVASTDWTWSVLFGDLDDDGRLDLFATNGIPRFDMDPDMQQQVQDLWEKRRYQAAIEVIKNVRRVPERNLALRNAGDLDFRRVEADWGLDLEAVTHGAALCDLDRDGDLDLVLNNWNEPAAVYENRTDDGSAILVSLRGQRSERFGCGARVEATLPDGRLVVRALTLARGYLSGQEPVLHFGLGDAAEVARLRVRWPCGAIDEFEHLAVGRHYTVTESPVAESGPPPAPRDTLFAPSQPQPFFHHENAFDEYRDQPLLPEELGRLGPALALGDADGDGEDDLFLGGARGQPGALLLADGARWKRVPGPWDDDVGCEDVGVLWLDADADGDLDLFVASGGASRPAGDPFLRDRLYRNDGGKFVRIDDALPDLRESSGHATAADFDGDGDPDLLVCGRLVPGAFPDAPPTRLYRNEGGRFADVTAELAPALRTAGMVQCALFTDVDGDGRLDLLLAAMWQPIRWLRQEDGRFVDRTAEAGLAGQTGWWTSLCAFDIDADGDLDYLAGNRGLNTKYKASPEHPAKLFYGDFDDDGRRDLIEAKYGGDTLLPVRGRSCSGGAMPFLKEKFRTYQQFAEATLGEIYSPQKLANSGELAATTLASSLLRNDGRGHFTVEPLPRRAQLAPIYGMVVLGDYVVCGENSYAPEPETGRHDGGTGLVLHAVDGRLEVVPPREHGIAFFADRKGIAARRRSDGRIELLFGCNDGPLVSYVTTGRRPVALPLDERLPPGTHVEIELADGRRRRLEVPSASSYLSQSSRPFVPPDVRSATRMGPGEPHEVRLSR